MIVSFTGPRHFKIGCETIPNDTYKHICSSIKNLLIELAPEKIISGFAQGVDLWAASIALSLDIPVVAAIAFDEQSKSFEPLYKKQFDKLLEFSTEVYIDKYYHEGVFQDRNEYMVDNSDKLIAVYNPTLGSGGTLNCINYAKQQNKEIIYIDPFENQEKSHGTN